MAEAFGIVAGALSVAGFAGQLAQSAALLHGFIGDIKHAPKTVRLIGEELQILSSILLEIQKSYNAAADADLGSSLQHCGKRLDELLLMIKRVDPAQYSQKRKRIWSHCQVALKGSDLRKYLAELDRCKLMLVQACNNISRAEQKIQTCQITSILQQTQNSVARQDLQAAASGAAQTTIQEIRQISSHVKATTDGVAATARETRLKIDESNTHMSRIGENTDLIRTMTERIELAQQVLINNATENKAAGVKFLKNEIHRSIGSSIEQHLKEHLAIPTTAQDILPRTAKHTSDGRHRTSPNMIEHGPVQCHTHAERFSYSRPVPKQFPHAWIRYSSSDTQQTLARNRIIGTVHLRTTTVTYHRGDDEDHVETKQGMVLSRQHSNCAGSQSTLHWSLSSINIVHSDAEIFRACYHHDFSKMTKLFDDGLASPYDVNSNGRTLIGYIAVGVMFHYHRSKHDTLRTRLDELNAMLDLLLATGIDAGCSDVNNFNPISMTASCWKEASAHLPSVSSENNYIDYILMKLLKEAKTDPFSHGKALVTVVPYHGPQTIEFPGEICYKNVNISPRHLDLLMRQEDWPLTWHSQQLYTLCGIIYHTLSDGVSEIRQHIAFWITSNAEDISIYLHTKWDLLLKLISHGELDTRKRHSVVQSLHITIHEGAEVIALLTRHLHCDCFRDRKPWIRHRFRKLLIIEQWLTQIFHFLLSVDSSSINNAPILDKLGEHAQVHSARVLCAWKKALKAFGRENTQDFGLQQYINHFTGRSALAEDEITVGKDTSSEWETEDSGEDDDSKWETEEELDDGRNSQSVRDRHCVDNINLDLKNQDRHTCDEHLYEYDESYWSHLYPCIQRSNLDT